MRPEVKAALLLTIVSLFIMLSVHPVSAWFSSDDYKVFNESDGDWGAIEIWDGKIIGSDEIATHNIVLKNTGKCELAYCHTEGQSQLYVNTILFHDLNFIGNQVKNPKIWIGHTEMQNKTTPILELQCETVEGMSNCHTVQTGTNETEKEVFIKDYEYNLGNILPAGDYEWQIEGMLYSGTTDWIIDATLGDNILSLTEWATWNSTYEDGLVSYLTFDTAAPSNESFTKDVFAGRNNGTVLGVINVSNGFNNQAYNSTTDIATRINVTNSTSGTANGLGFNLSAGFTLSLWAKKSNATSGMVVAEKGNGGQFRGWELWLGAGDTNAGTLWELWHTDAATFNTNLATATAAKNNSWTNLVVVGNISGVFFWVNGTLIGSDLVHAGTKDVINSPLLLFAPSETYSSSLGWNGHIDEVAIWNRSLTDNEVVGLYNGGVGIFFSPSVSGVPISIITNISQPVNNTNFTSGATLNFNATLTPTNANTTNATLYIWDSAGAIYRRNFNKSVFNTTTSVNVSFTNSSFADGVYTWNVEGCAVNSTASICAFAVNNFTFTVDSTPPVVAIIYPANNSNVTYQVAGTNLTLNFSVFDSGGPLSMCWYEYGGVNVTTSCTANASFNTTNYGTRTIKLYANDTLGNLNSTIHNWNYTIWQTALTYNSPVPMGSSQEFRLNITANPSPTAINFTYNSTTYQASFTTNGNNYSASRTLVTPTINYSSMLIPFYWTIYSSNGNAYNSSTNNQNVTQITLDDCSTNAIVLYNFTIKDEADQYTLNATANSTFAKIDLQIYPVGSSSLFLQFNKTYNQTNPFAICLNANLSNAQYSTTSVIEYKATGYQIEFYNIQNSTLNDSLLYQNISLYDLLTTSAQPFKLIVKDSSFLSIENAIVEVYRKYISEGVYKIVEIPKTDAAGETTASLVINDAIYKFIIKKFGHTISTFTDVRAICQNPTITTCQIDFNAFESGIEVPDYEQEEDFNFTLGYNKTSRIVTSRFLIPSGTPATVRLNVTIQDALGTQACSDIITSTTGTLTCTIPQTLGNMSAFAKIYRDEKLQASGSVSQSEKASDIYGSIQLLLALFIMLTLIGAAMSDNPVFTVLFFMAGVILLFGVHLVENTGFIGAGATILFLVIAVIIIIIKGSRRS